MFIIHMKSLEVILQRIEDWDDEEMRFEKIVKYFE